MPASCPSSMTWSFGFSVFDGFGGSMPASCRAGNTPEAPNNCTAGPITTNVPRLSTADADSQSPMKREPGSMRIPDALYDISAASLASSSSSSDKAASCLRWGAALGTLGRELPMSSTETSSSSMSSCSSPSSSASSSSWYTQTQEY